MDATTSISSYLSGAGLGLRRGFGHSPLLDQNTGQVDFLEIAPENWMTLGGKWKDRFKHLTTIFPFSAHGLSLSIGGPEPFDLDFLANMKSFLDEFNIGLYSEHLSYCSDEGQLYDLMPIPFTEEAVKYVSERIQFLQSFFERPIAVENVSFYAPTETDMTELEFFNAVVDEATCQVLLDVNNVYVNSINHQYDPKAFIASVDPNRVCYYHIAGHYNEAEDLKVDTHGADVIPEVWSLLHYAYEKIGVKPTLLERDFNYPPLDVLFQEVNQIKKIQSKFQLHQHQVA